MKLGEELLPKSSFLSVEKDLNTIVNVLMANNRLQKLLYYNVPDCLDKPNLSKEEKYALLGKNIKIVPKVEVDSDIKNYIIIGFDDFSQNATNPEFRDNIIMFDIICNFEQWQLKDFQLRPYRIAAEIDSIITQKRLSGIGEIEFIGAKRLLLTEHQGGICLIYQVIHGGEDKVNMPNPEDEKKFLEDFEEMLKSNLI